MNDVTVITVTRERPKMLKRAIASIFHQQCCFKINHLILIDDCQDTKKMLEKHNFSNSHLLWKYMPRKASEYSGPGRSAVLRNHGVQISKSRWISFLDDDNEYEKNHIQTLIDCILESGAFVAHSYLKVFYRDGRPYIQDEHPWEINGLSKKDSFKWLVEKGVRIPGSNIFQDRGDPKGTKNPVRTIDTNAFFFERNILIQFPFTEEYSRDDLERMEGEDDKLLRDLIENDIQLACTKKATVFYYLGGYSNMIV